MSWKGSRGKKYQPAARNKGTKLFSVLVHNIKRGNSQKLWLGSFVLDIGRTFFFCCENGAAVVQVSQTDSKISSRITYTKLSMPVLIKCWQYSSFELEVGPDDILNSLPTNICFYELWSYQILTVHIRSKNVEFLFFKEILSMSGIFDLSALISCSY